MTLCDHHFGLKNWLYIIFGYMLQNYNEQEVNNVWISWFPCIWRQEVIDSQLMIFE